MRFVPSSATLFGDRSPCVYVCFGAPNGPKETNHAASKAAMKKIGTVKPHTEVVDLCADELVTVTRAFLARLSWLEEVQWLSAAQTR